MNKNLSFLTPVRVGMVIILFIFIIFLQLGTRESKASIKTVSENVSSSVDLSAMEKSTNRMFKKFYGLNAKDYEGVTLYAPLTNMAAEEILIVKLKDSSQAEAVTQAVNARLETQKSSFEGYGIEQYDLLENHVLDVRGNFILYIVHTDAAKADKAFRDSL